MKHGSHLLCLGLSVVARGELSQVSPVVTCHLPVEDLRNGWVADMRGCGQRGKPNGVSGSSARTWPSAVLSSGSKNRSRTSNSSRHIFSSSFSTCGHTEFSKRCISGIKCVGVVVPCVMKLPHKPTFSRSASTVTVITCYNVDNGGGAARREPSAVANSHCVIRVTFSPSPFSFSFDSMLLNTLHDARRAPTTFL